eukprot:scaffold712_cov69-Cyclotella_meneghiniana.AAC.2
MFGGFDNQLAARFKCGGYGLVPGGKMNRGNGFGGFVMGRTNKTCDAAALASMPSVPLHRPFVPASNTKASAFAFIGRGERPCNYSIDGCDGRWGDRSLDDGSLATRWQGRQFEVECHKRFFFCAGCAGPLEERGAYPFGCMLYAIPRNHSSVTGISLNGDLKEPPVMAQDQNR